MHQAFTEDLALLIERGGYVMVPLLALSVISLALILERCWFWLSLHRPGRLRKLSTLNDAFRRGERNEAASVVKNDRSPYGRIARKLMEQGSTDAVAVEAVQEYRPMFDRFMVSLSTIVTAAPLLGILGTVIGIIQSFKLLGDRVTLSDPHEVADGIAAALLTTALGLIIALFTLFPYMIFKGQVDRAIGRLESMIAAAQQGLRPEEQPSVRSGEQAPASTVRTEPSPQTPAAPSTPRPEQSRESVHG